MKGIVFTEFMEMVEQAYGYEMVDALIEDNELPSGGAYTNVGTYDFQEMVQLVTSLSEKVQAPVPKLLHTFGCHLFKSFKKGYPAFLEAASDAFDFLESIEKYIHVEVRKLYPDAELPTFKTHRPNEQTLEMLYFSERRMGDFALGLIESSLKYYDEQANVTMTPLNESKSEVQFTIERQMKNIAG